jgi:hypothetical protein
LSRRETSNAAPQRRAVEPHAVHVGVHEVRRNLARGGVEHLERRGVRPQRVAEARPDPDAVGEQRCAAHDRRGLGSRGRLAQRLALGRQGPLHDVDVVIPQSRDEPGTVASEHPPASRQGARGRDVGDGATGQVHVDRIVAERVHALTAAETDVSDDVDRLAPAEAHRAALRAEKSRCISPTRRGSA